MILYDWRDLKNKEVWSALDCLMKPEYLIRQKCRDSYLLDVKKIYLNKCNATDTEIWVYLDLASKRNYYNYKYNKINTLKINYIDYDINKLYMNKLLKITKYEIIFKYEEI